MLVQQFGALLADNKKLRRHITLVTLTSLVLAIIAALLFDQQLSAYFNRPEIRDLYRAPARVITDLGLSDYYFALAILTWGFCRFFALRIQWFKKYSAVVDYFRRWGLNLLVALLVSGAITHIIKFCVGRQRPHKTPDFDPFIFNHFTTHWHWHSFSSGHSQVMFTAATMFSIAFPRLRWVWIPVAILVCGTRIVVHDHFLSDTIFGACVGYVGTLLALKWMKAKSSNSLY